MQTTGSSVAPIDVDLLSVDNTQSVKQKKSNLKAKKDTAPVRKSLQTPPDAETIIDRDSTLTGHGHGCDDWLEDVTQLCDNPDTIDDDAKPKQWYQCNSNNPSTGKNCLQLWSKPHT